MTEQSIESLFNEHIHNKESVKASGLSRQQIYNYRNREISLGTKIDFLFKAKVINITLNEHPPKTK